MPTDPMAEIRATFFAECDELMEALTDGLTTLANGARGKDTVNAVFRAVHSIKGGAGAFGFDGLVSFAHKFETALDELRSGSIDADAATIAIFFRSADHLADLIIQASGGPQPATNTEEHLCGELETLAARAVPHSDQGPIDFVPVAVSLDDFAGDVAQPFGKTFHILFRPYPEMFASGNDPVFILNALAEMGEMIAKCDTSDLPGIDELDPQNCYLHWSIDLRTNLGREDIMDAASFVDGLCDFVVNEYGAAAGPVLSPLTDFEHPGFDPTLNFEPANAPALQPMALQNAPVPPCPATSADFARSAADAGTPETNIRRDVAKPKDGGTDPRPTVRVDLDRIDRLVNLVGELVINQSMLSQEISAAGLANSSAVTVGLEEFLNLSRNIQESVMMIRAQPIKPLFTRMARILREATAESGKQVRLNTEGENTEIDKTVVERLADPLTHMIRNAIDHGLEQADTRIAAGKPPEGVVTLCAGHRSGRVVIEVRDDGAGIDRPKVLAAAVKKGLVAPDQPMTESDIDNLLFLPGFSTATEVSNLSGRGVGMDVVRNAIQDIGGRINISSERGKGTTFSISLPLTLAVLDGMVVRITNERIVIPLSAIMETLTFDAQQVSAFGIDRRIVKIRDGFFPLLDLGVELGYRSVPTTDEDAVVLVIAQDSGHQVALIVDRIEEQRQVVIKGIEKNYGRVPGIAAATILGDGSIALILDPADFVTLASSRARISMGTLALAG